MEMLRLEIRNPENLSYSLKECIFVNSALKIQCHVVKNTLLETAFSAILPTGIALRGHRGVK